MTSAPQRPRSNTLLRLRVGFLLIAMVLSLFAVRLVQLQVLDPGKYAAMAHAEGLREVVLPAERGEIVDRNGVALAASMDGLMVIADPKLTSEYAGELATYLADSLGVDYFTTLEKLRKTEGAGSRYQYIARRVPATKASKVVEAAKAKGWVGLTTERDPIRTYPGKDIAANLVGFIGSDDEAGALAGLERTFDDHLSGKDGMTTYQEGGNKKIPLGDSSTTEPVDGQDLQLTIDKDTQLYVQRVLGARVREVGAVSGAAIVMDTKTGDLLAYADYPTFDANDPTRTPKKFRGSIAVQDPYEPGSVEKVLTMAALIEEGKADPMDRVTVPSQIEVGGWPIGDYFQHDTLKLTLTGVLAKSSNIGTVLASQALSNEELHGYLTSFGLGQRTGVGIRAETAGQLAPWESWQSISHATISFGQGLSVNALQMTAAINTIANGGVRVDPNLIVGSATDENGTEVGTDHATSHRVVSEETAQKLNFMMQKVVVPGEGVAPSAQVPNYTVAGKTGTAQIAEDGGYLDGAFNVSFAGFAPAEDPQFTVYVVIKKPANSALGGGATAGPVFRKIMTYLLTHYAVPPPEAETNPYEVEWGATRSDSLTP